jgi:hypothetical protein
MKKLLISILLIFQNLVGIAQEADDLRSTLKEGSAILKEKQATPRHGGGLKIGLNMSTFNSSQQINSIEYNSKIGVSTGIYYHLFLNPKIALQSEVLFSQKGASYQNLGDNFTINISYIDIPLLFRYQISNLFNLQLGPQTGLLLSAARVLDGSSENIRDNFNSFDLGITFGAGIDFSFGLNFALRYSLGLSNIASNSMANQSIKNNFLHLSIGYKLFERE